MPSLLAWSDWQPLVLGDWDELAPRPSGESTAPASRVPAILAEVLDGGQAFRWVRTQDGLWQGVWGGCVARLKPVEPGGLAWSAPQNLAETVGRELPGYLAAAVNFARLADSLP